MKNVIIFTAALAVLATSCCGGKGDSVPEQDTARYYHNVDLLYLATVYNSEETWNYVGLARTLDGKQEVRVDIYNDWNDFKVYRYGDTLHYDYISKDRFFTPTHPWKRAVDTVQVPLVIRDTVHHYHTTEIHHHHYKK